MQHLLGAYSPMRRRLPRRRGEPRVHGGQDRRQGEANVHVRLQQERRHEEASQGNREAPVGSPQVQPQLRDEAQRHFGHTLGERALQVRVRQGEPAAGIRETDQLPQGQEEEKHILPLPGKPILRLHKSKQS